MPARCPHFLLFSQTTGAARNTADLRRPKWRFVLEDLDGQSRMVAEDVEPGTRTNRLELLAVVRGLEALDGPSRVTLVTGSRYVTRGIRRGLNEWRRHNWRWERFGRWVPIRDHDLWRRVDRALQFHQIDCRTWRVDEAESEASEPAQPMTAHAQAHAQELNDRAMRSCGRGEGRGHGLSQVQREFQTAAKLSYRAERPQLASA